jgi:signal transduction histidine kinase
MPFFVCAPGFSVIVGRMWPIVRDAFAGASAATRVQLRWIAASWILLLCLQIWDSRNGRGPAGVAEFLSAVLGMTGLALLGLAHALQQAMAEVAARRERSRDPALQDVLIALPVLGFAAGALLSAATVLMVLRALLGAELPLALTGTLVYGGLLIVAHRTVVRSTRTLFAHASRNATLAADARSDAAAAQVQALQARMNPHFLFNALNTVASLVRSNPRAAEQVVENLSDVLRRTLERSSGTSGTLRDEVDYLRAYLALEQQRWGDRLRVEWSVDETALPAPLPPLVLQPLVENSLKHGLNGSLDGGTIRISARADANRLLLSVQDDGIGFARGWREGTGLGNLRQRLVAHYSGDASLDVIAQPPGARVTVNLPFTCGS